MIQLGVNVDHVATIRQARYREAPDSPHAEPDPVEAALAAERGGAAGITVHLRADRRHIQDRDLCRLSDSISTKLNLELGNTEEIIRIALELRPRDVCLVPENRQEVTTEGGLDCATHFNELQTSVARLRDAGIRVSIFIDPDPRQVEASARLKAEFVELHTGGYANGREGELARLHQAAKDARSAGLRVNAGHGLTTRNVGPILGMDGLEELNIGHSIVSRAVLIGMEAATREMLAAIRT